MSSNFRWLVGPLVSWTVGWLVRCLLGPLVGLSVSPLVSSLLTISSKLVKNTFLWILKRGKRNEEKAMSRRKEQRGGSMMTCPNVICYLVLA